MEDSPPPFITFRSADERAYRRGLELVEHVHRVLEQADAARYQLKDQLERLTTTLAIQLARAGDDIRPARWRWYRDAHRSATDCRTLLDVLAAKGVTSGALADARGALRALLDELARLTLR
jgi:hypothetical protein